MNIQNSKENIQPLATGRNAERLETALDAETNLESREEIERQRKALENAIKNYEGDDPLESWLEYIHFIEQTFPKSGKEAKLDEILKKCLVKFEKKAQYDQDPRFVRIFTKFIDSKKDPTRYYEKMYNSGKGSRVSEFYIAWAFYYDFIDNFEKAGKIYQKGLDARAEPVEQLKEAYTRFQFSVGQRMILKEDYRPDFIKTMEAQRHAFTSLLTFKKAKKVGSTRTAVKSHTPGTVRQRETISSVKKAQYKIFEGPSESEERKQLDLSTSFVEDIERCDIENRMEPGPWSKKLLSKSVYDKSKNQKSTFNNSIFQDDDDDKKKTEEVEKVVYILPPRNDPQTPFIIAAYIYENFGPNVFPCYDTFFLHPNTTICFSNEELRYYRRCKDKGIENDFTRRQDKIWGLGPTIPMRKHSRFVAKNKPFFDMVTERHAITALPSNERFACKVEAIYEEHSNAELSLEEILKTRSMKRNNNDGMDETVCVVGRQSFGVKYNRRSIVGGRKSIIPSYTPLRKNVEHMEADESKCIEADDCDEMEIDEGCREKIKWPGPNKVSLPDEENQENVGGLCIAPTVPTGEPMPKKNEQPVGWSVFTDDAEIVDKNAQVDKKEVVGTSDLKRTHGECPLGPQTGAIRKTNRKTLVRQNQIMSREDPEATNLDYSLCTQNFNSDLAKQIMSTPVPPRRVDPLTEVKKHETQKLSTIMETSEGSAQTVSSKSSIEFVSPENEETSTARNSTKITVTAPSSTEDAFDGQKSSQTSDALPNFENYSFNNVEKTLPTIQMSFPLEALAGKDLFSSSPNSPAKDQRKNYPFEIFEDSQLTASNLEPNLIPKQNQSLTVKVEKTIEPTASSLKPNLSLKPNHSLTVKIEPSQIAEPSRIDQLNLSSFWIKDEPQSFAGNTLSDEDFAMPTSNYSARWTKQNFDTTTLIGDCGDSSVLPVSSEGSDESEMEVIEVPDDTITFDTIPKIVDVQSYALKDNSILGDRLSISMDEEELERFNKFLVKGVKNNNLEESIYFVNREAYSKEPAWEEGNPDVKLHTGVYLNDDTNLEDSRMVIESKISRSSLDPFDDQLRNAILTNLGFVADLEKLETIVMVQNVAPVAVNQKIVFKDTHFNVSKLIGKGAYGRVYKVKLAEKDITFAVKKEMPPNLWELYILLELQKRIPEHLMSAFMTPEYAIVGNNATLIFASFSPYGTLLDVVNNVFNRTGKNVDETVVFILAFQMLVIIEQLHRGDILHLDLKPDNFLVMKKLTKDSDDCILQLIDFGNAVDLRRFPSKQKFNGTVETDKFKCSEMKEGRPWVYQPDLYCLAGTIHALLFGTYMDVQTVQSRYAIKTKIPRYYNGDLWNLVFDALLNSTEERPDLTIIKEKLLAEFLKDKNASKKLDVFRECTIIKN